MEQVSFELRRSFATRKRFQFPVNLIENDDIYTYWHDPQSDDWASNYLSVLLQSLESTPFKVGDIISIQFSTLNLGYKRNLVADYKSHYFKISHVLHEYCENNPGKIIYFEYLYLLPVKNECDID